MMSEKKIKRTSVSLDMIQEVNSLEQLVTYDDLIRKHCVMLSKGNREVADEIVQIMYITLNDYFEKYPDKKINGGFVSMTLRSRLKNHYLYNSRFDLGTSNEGADIEEAIDVSYADNQTIQDKLEDELLYEELERRMENLTWYEKKIVEYSFEMNIAELSRLSDIAYLNLNYSYNKAKNKLKQSNN